MSDFPKWRLIAASALLGIVLMVFTVLVSL